MGGSRQDTYRWNFKADIDIMPETDFRIFRLRGWNT